MPVPTRRILDPMYGEPSLASANNGKASWVRGATSPLDQKGSTGWLARLYGGVQTGDDWARFNIPVGEEKLTNFNSAMWSYYMTATETMGVNMVIWIHDPKDFDKRAEVTQLGGHADLEKTSGWNAFEFSTATGGMFFYGENTTGTGLTAGTQYTWAQFQADVLFKHWRIYRITFEWGWEASGTFDDVYLADVKLNGLVVRMRPANGAHQIEVLTSKTLECAGGYSAEDVVSESDTNAAGTDWDFDFGGVGYITKAVVHHPTTALTARYTLFLFSKPPTSELDDNAANTAPAVADAPFFLGTIDFPALSDLGTGPSYAVATPSTTGNLPIEFDSPIVYGIMVTRDAEDPGDSTLLTIILSGDMVDN